MPELVMLGMELMWRCYTVLSLDTVTASVCFRGSWENRDSTGVNGKFATGDKGVTLLSSIFCAQCEEAQYGHWPEDRHWYEEVLETWV